MAMDCSGITQASMSVYLGLDCGGTSCRALALDRSGAHIFSGQAGSANIATNRPERILKNLRHASLNCPKPDFVCGCFAGLLTELDKRQAIELLKEAFPYSVVRAEPDYRAPLKLSEGSQICVLAGTGSLVCSLHEGKIEKSGGRGYVLGDKGSAFQYGRIALLHFLDDPAGASRHLKSAIRERFGSIKEPEIVAALYKGGVPASQLAKLFAAFARDAKAGEPYALNAVHVQTSLLAEVVHKHVKQHFSAQSRLTVSLVGGVWSGASLFKDALKVHLEQELPQVDLELKKISQPPVRGAAELAMELDS